MNNKLQIVKYTKDLAEKVSCMWRESGEGWQGEDIRKTPKQVQQEFENSGYLAVYIALLDGKAVGYVDLNYMNNDAEALYLGLLNVRPEYHGKKIGKELVKKAVLTTRKLGFKRLYLHTWSGNTKAVPLYKKCGFFWEADNSSIKLVNFIPEITENQLVKSYFDKIDWYDNVSRKIEVKPDGIKLNKFDIYKYEWKKDDLYLNTEYTLKGRGLKSIDCNDFTIDCKIKNRDLIYENSYEIEYFFKNKTNKPVNVSIKGISHKNIKFDYENSFVLQDTKTITANFFVAESNVELTKEMIYPQVISNISLNGKTAKFATGIAYKVPVMFEIAKKSKIHYADEKGHMMLNIKSNLDYNAEVSFKIPNYNGIEFANKQHTFMLNAKEKKAIKLSYTFKKACWLDKEFNVKIKAETNNFAFNYRFLNVLPSPCNSVNGYTKKAFLATNGLKAMQVNTANQLTTNFIDFADYQNKYFKVYSPSFGKPFTKEFTIRKPDDFICTSNNMYKQITATYIPKNIKGIKTDIIYRFYANGIAYKWLEVKPDIDIQNEFFINEVFCINTANTVIPINNKIVKLPKHEQNFWDLRKWNINEMHENWIFADSPANVGICWEDGLNIGLNGWNINVLHKFSNLKANNVYKSKKITISLGAFEKFSDFRNFALKTYTKKAPTVNALSIELNNGNPFVTNKALLNVKQNKIYKLEDSFEIKDENNATVFKTSFDGKTRNFNADIPIKRNKNYGKLKFITKNKSFKNYYNRTVFFATSQAIEQKYIQQNSKNILHASNGVLNIKASNNFAPCLFNIEYKNKNLLDTSFPDIIAKSWWKPWFGGLYTLPNNFKLDMALKEEFSTEFASLKDNFGNNWQGIKITIKINKNETFKGITYENYYLMLGNSNVLCCVSKIINNSKHAQYLCCSHNGFLKPNKNICDSIINVKYDDGYIAKTNVGENELSFESKNSIMLTDKKEDLAVHFFGNDMFDNSEVYANIEVLMFNKSDYVFDEDGSNKFTKPVFYIFTEKSNNFSYDDLRYLTNIKFK